MPTVRQIASRAGVSKTTVSLVLNNKEGVSDELRQRVRDALYELESISLAQSTDRINLSSESKPTSVVLLHSFISSVQFFKELLQGIQAAADRYQIQLRLVSMNAVEHETLGSHLYFADPHLKPDGVLVIAAGKYELLIGQLRKLQIPYVLVGGPSFDDSINMVTPNEVDAGYCATRYLLDLGHRAIAFVSAHLTSRYPLDRLKGYKMALQEKGIEPQEQWVAVGHQAAPLQRILNDCPEVTAVIFANQAIAMTGLPAIQAAGYSIPDQLSVIVIDDTSDVRLFTPPLTTVTFPLYQEGFWSVRMLVDMIHDPEIENFQIMFRVKVVERESCAPPHSQPIGQPMK
jgi:LacI family transcriptional regulator